MFRRNSFQEPFIGLVQNAAPCCKFPIVSVRFEDAAKPAPARERGESEASEREKRGGYAGGGVGVRGGMLRGDSVL